MISSSSFLHRFPVGSIRLTCTAVAFAHSLSFNAFGSELMHSLSLSLSRCYQVTCLYDNAQRTNSDDSRILFADIVAHSNEPGQKGGGWVYAEVLQSASREISL